MRGIILAAAAQARRTTTARPTGHRTGHPLAPVLDKPMIYYPLSTLMLAGIQDVLVIASPSDEAALRRVLGDGSLWGIRIRIAVQPEPDGMARALTMATTFIGDQKVALALGDNVLHGPGVGRALAAHTDVDGALVFGQRVGNPGDYGVVEFDRDGDVLSIEEKPHRPRSEFAVPGLYFYDNTVVAIAARVASSPGRRDLTAINEIFRQQGRLRVSLLGPETAWLDAGDLDSMAAAAEFVRTVEVTQGFKIGCVEEVAWRQGWIDDDALLALSGAAGRTGYGNYLGLLAGRRRDRTMIELPAQPPVSRLRRPRTHQTAR